MSLPSITPFLQPPDRATEGSDFGTALAAWVTGNNATITSFNAFMAAVQSQVPAAIGALGLSTASEVSITAAITLDASCFGKMHVCTGTAADYPVGLPAAAGNAGKLFGIRISYACTKIVTLNANSGELIDGLASNVMLAGDTAILLCDGFGWIKISGKSRPTTAQEVIAGTDTNRSITAAGAAAVYFGLSGRTPTGFQTQLAPIVLTTAHLGRIYDVWGYSYDTTFVLPPVADSSGKLIGFKINTYCTRLITLDGNSGELIDGALTRTLWAGETVILYCDGASWYKISGKSIPMICRLACPAGQSIPSATYTNVQLPTVQIGVGGMDDPSNNKIVIKRPGKYRLSAQVSLQGGAATTSLAAQILVNGASAQIGNCHGLIYGVANIPEYIVDCAASVVLTLRAYHDYASALTTGSWGTFLSVEEIIQW